MARKIRVGILFGGRSAEHEVSLQSAKNIIDAIDTNKYELVLIGIDKKGQWRARKVPRAATGCPCIGLASRRQQLLCAGAPINHP
jgi:D-alanine-D-alanine ligase-like ATP-grasp enzyme